MTREVPEVSHAHRTIQYIGSYLEEDKYLIDGKVQVKPSSIQMGFFLLYLDEGGKCRYCGNTNILELTVEHIVPICRGGSRKKKSNIGISCYTCNNHKGSLTEAEYLYYKSIDFQGLSPFKKYIQSQIDPGYRVSTSNYGVRLGSVKFPCTIEGASLNTKENDDEVLEVSELEKLTTEEAMD